MLTTLCAIVAVSLAFASGDAWLAEKEYEVLSLLQLRAHVHDSFSGHVNDSPGHVTDGPGSINKIPQSGFFFAEDQEEGKKGANEFTQWTRQLVPPGTKTGTVMLLVVCAVASTGWICSSRSGCNTDKNANAQRNRFDLFSLQATFLVDSFLEMASFTALIPESYNLAHDLGFGAAASGILISGFFWLWGLGAFGAHKLLETWPKLSVKIAVVMMNWIQLACFIAFALVADPPKMMPIRTPAERFACLLALRFLMGFCQSASNTYRQILASRCTLNSQMVRFNVCTMCTTAIGIGSGPLVSAVAVMFSGAVGAPARTAIVACAFVVPWASYMLTAMMIAPSSIDHLLDDKALADVEDAASKMYGSSPRSTPGLEDALPFTSKQGRRSVWVAGAIFGTERAFIVSALEAGTAFVLQEEFHWSTESIGLAIGVTFFVSLPLTVVLEGARSYRLVTDLQLLCSSCCICAVAALLFFPYTGTILSMGGDSRAGLILVADCLMFSFGFLGNGVMDGLCVKSSIEHSYYSCQNFIIVSNTLRSLARGLGPPIARAVLSSYGRSVYADFQFVLAVLSCLTCLHVVSGVQHRA